MITRFLPHIVAWAVLTTIVVFLAIYRRKIGLTADETLHVLDSDAAEVPVQAAVARKLAVVDRWGKILTVVAILYLLGIAAMYFYMAYRDVGIKLS
jgi:hypothetical protein